MNISSFSFMSWGRLFLLGIMTILIGLVVLTGFTQTSPQSAQPTPILMPAGDNFDFDVGLSAVMLGEDGRELSLAEAQAADDWMPVNLALIDGSRANPDASSTAPYAMGNPTWVHMTLVNNSDMPRRAVLDTQRPDLRKAVIYDVGSDGNIETLLDHYQYEPLSARPIKYSELAVLLDFAPREEKQIYMRYVRTAGEPMPLKVYGLAAYSDKVRHKAVLIAAFLAVLGTIILITLLGLPALGWKIAFSYIIYVAAVGLWYAGITGHFFSILTPANPVLGHNAVEAFAALVFAAFLNMGRVLFRYNEINRFYDKLLLAVIFIDLALAVIICFVDIYQAPVLAYTFSIFTAISCILYVANAVIAVRAKRDGSMVMLLGSFSLLVAFIIYRFVTVAVNSGDIVLPIGRIILIPPVSFIEISCFAIAMIQGQIGIRRQRDKAVQVQLETAEEKLRLSQALRESETSYEKARRQAELRRERLSTVSHDILQPLTSLRTSLGNAKRMDPSRAQQMSDAFDYLEALAKDSLVPATPENEEEADYARQEETFKISAVTDNVHAMFKGEAEAKGLEFDYDTDNTSISTHPVELMRIISNLVSNAIKHTESGHVKLHTRKTDNAVEICVEDTGTGMSAAEIETFLQPYKKSEKSQGTGLGLYQAKAACEDLGHEFRIDSEPEKGTTARIII